MSCNSICICIWAYIQVVFKHAQISISVTDLKIRFWTSPTYCQKLIIIHNMYLFIYSIYEYIYRSFIYHEHWILLADTTGSCNSGLTFNTTATHGTIRFPAVNQFGYYSYSAGLDCYWAFVAPSDTTLQVCARLKWCCWLLICWGEA